MKKVYTTNTAAGFPANDSFLNWVNDSILDLNVMWKDETFGNDDQIIKGVSVSKSVIQTTLGPGLILLGGELFIFPGAVLDTVDTSKIHLYAVDDLRNEIYGDLSSLPAYNYRTLAAKVEATGGNFRSLKRSFLFPIREYNTTIDITPITETLNHSIFEHRKDKIKVNASIRSSTSSDSVVIFSPGVGANTIFTTYYRPSYTNFVRKIAGKFQALHYDSNNVLISGVSGMIIQEGAVFYFYNYSGNKLTVKQLTGVDAGGAHPEITYADIMIDMEIITSLI
jgi:hypothetical protein